MSKMRAKASAAAIARRGRWVLLALSLLALPACFPLDLPARAQYGGGTGQHVSMVGVRRLTALRGGSMPGLGMGGLSMDAMDKMMTPDMIRGAASMMSSMDPSLLNSMMSMTGLGGGDMAVDAEEMKRAAEKLRAMSTDEILAMKTGALKAPFPGDQARMPPATEELLCRAEKLKQDGNEMHINKNYEAAVAKYEEAKATLTTSTAWPKAASLVRSCSLNEASCYLQLGDWKKVEEICTAVLATDRRNLKALYRR